MYVCSMCVRVFLSFSLSVSASMSRSPFGSSVFAHTLDVRLDECIVSNTRATQIFA